MKIVYVYDALALYGGIERILIEKMNYLSQLPNYQIYIITTNQGNHPISFPLLPEVEHIDLNIRFHTKYQYKLLRRLYYSHKLNKLFKKRLKEIHPELVVTGEYINNCTPIKIYCTAHDYTFSSKPVDILKRINCCDKSRKTYKEEYICSFIEETYGFLITRQKKFDDCKDKNYLPFDIYLDDYNRISRRTTL